MTMDEYLSQIIYKWSSVS